MGDSGSACSAARGWWPRISLAVTLWEFSTFSDFLVIRVVAGSPQCERLWPALLSLTSEFMFLPGSSQCERLWPAAQLPMQQLPMQLSSPSLCDQQWLVLSQCERLWSAAQLSMTSPSRCEQPWLVTSICSLANCSSGGGVGGGS